MRCDPLHGIGSGVNSSEVKRRFHAPMVARPLGRRNAPTDHVAFKRLNA
jgi:hypothetical protein